MHRYQEPELELELKDVQDEPSNIENKSGTTAYRELFTIDSKGMNRLQSHIIDEVYIEPMEGVFNDPTKFAVINHIDNDISFQADDELTTDNNNGIRIEHEETTFIGDDVFDVVPEGFVPGLRVTTPTRLSDSGLVKYSPVGIMRLYHNGEIPGYKIGKNIFLTEDAIKLLLERQRLREAGELRVDGMRVGGRRPGSLRRR